MNLAAYYHEPQDGGVTWEQLGVGAPTVMAMARISANALVQGSQPMEPLSAEAEGILFLARQRGMLELKGFNTAFETPSRILAVHVEVADQRWVAVRDSSQSAITIAFLDGFRELCAAGLVVHQLGHEFSLTRAGFARAAQVKPEAARETLSRCDQLDASDLSDA